MIPILTIAIPTYNRAKFLPSALDSIISQYQEGVEILISDNGSTDNTLQIIESFIKNYSYIRVCGSKTNRGIDENILNVISNARGEYVHLFSDDDLLTDGALKVIINEIKKVHPEVLSLNHYCFKETGEVLPPFLPEKKVVFEKGEDFFKYCGLGFLSSLVFRKSSSLKFFQEVRLGKECAHIDIVSRIVLLGLGPYVCLGNAMVAGRSLDTPRYSMIQSCVINQKELHDELYAQGILSRNSHLFFSRRLIKDTVRIAFKMLRKSQGIKQFKEVLLQNFKELPILSRLMIYFLSMNKKAVFVVLLAASKTVSSYRTLKRKIYEKKNVKISV